jgi:hypothetical protein
VTNFEVQKQIKNTDEHQNINDNKSESHMPKKKKNDIQVFIGFL